MDIYSRVTAAPPEWKTQYRLLYEPVTGLVLIDALFLKRFGYVLGRCRAFNSSSCDSFFHPAAFIARMTRASIIEVKSQDFIRTARAKGYSELVALVKHGLRPAMLPVFTVMGLQFDFARRSCDH